ncbi:MAG: beta-lactamase family protein [Alphaproteobacteria bacterium]|nr:beta-lactamase family protein [Alphaproteobacteria bacterium]
MRSALLLLPLLGCAAPEAGPPTETDPTPTVCPAVPDAWPETPASLDEDVAAGMQAARVPGLSACLTSGDRVLWCRGYGWANVETEVPATADTPFLLASVSKLFTATAVLQAHARGELDLDQDADALVPFSFQHPDAPGTPITPRALLAHVGGIADNDAVMDTFYTTGQDPSVSLAALNEGYFDPDGQWYDADRNFEPDGPEQVYSYANMGYAALGYLAEAATGQDFVALTEARIFEPLGMDRTSWRVADLDLDEVAMPYRFRAGSYEPQGHYTFADFPNGGLRSTAQDVACFLAAMAAGGGLGDAEILNTALLEEAMTPAFPRLDDAQGLGWYREDMGESQLWIGHSGGENGAATDVFMRQDGSLGLVLLMNGDWDREDAIYDIEDALVAFGDGL